MKAEQGIGDKDAGALRFITCGSVDDGKSTLIGRILYDSRNVLDDQLKSLERDSQEQGTQPGGLDFALLVDGLQAEREQGITIDVAYRFFSTDKRHFIVADTPGHEQYTRNMATGASTANLAVLLVDARTGILLQTRRHSRIVALMGIRKVVLAVNKMDLVDYDQSIFEKIKFEYQAFAEELGFLDNVVIPVSALKGDNVTVNSRRMAWYHGPTLLQYLESVRTTEDDSIGPFRMAVQFVNRPNSEFRGYCGTIAQGVLKKGDAVRVFPAGSIAQVKEIWRGFDRVVNAVRESSVTLTFSEDVDVSRGDVLTSEMDPIGVADQFEVLIHPL